MSIDIRGARALVTGGSGFIGGRLVRRLLALGCEVHATGREPGGLGGLPVRFHAAPLSQPERFGGLVRELRPDICFHLAARTERARDPALLSAMLRENALPTAALCEALCEIPGARLVALCSAEDYGLSPGPWREEAREAPVSPYGLSKAVVAATIRTARAAFGLQAAAGRPSVVYGPGQRPGQLLPSLILACLAGEPFPMTAGEQRRDFVYVDDVVEGLLALLSPEAAGEVFNLCSGRSERVADVARMARAMIGAGELQLGALSYRPSEIMNQELSPSAARARLGWEAKISLEEGLRRTIDSYR